MNESIWEGVKLPAYPSLSQDISTEVLVIGGGICGVLCAYFLSRKHKVTLVEANQIAGSRTNKTTATITALQDVYYKDLIKTFGKAKAKQYLDANLEAVEEYAKLSKEYAFDFERVSSYKYFKNDDRLLQKELAAIEKLRYFPKIEDDYAICFPNQGQMNPIKLILELTKNFNIYENTKVVQIKGQTAYTEFHKIQANHIVVCTGYPFLRLKGLYPLKLTQKKSYVVSLETSPLKQSFHAIGCDEGDLYFRTYKNQLIIGGNDQKTGRNQFGFIPLMKYIEKHYPDSKITHQWVNQDCVSLDGIPYIGKYFKKHSVYVATGFNLWGMTGSMIAAKIITDSIEGRTNPYTALFKPTRRSPLLPLLNNVKTAMIHLVLPKKRCTHLGCALYYNKEEGVYECPCHGTKYTEFGEVLFNPANRNKK
ncbi:MAG: FAD-dependent oxidoreductase [Anaeroplasmataceae bacterium]|nr:FAD-dependent oxidoreductase [Anaeroplasmataceae bacterium]